MAIVDPRGYNLVPDASGLANTLLKAFQVRQSNQKEADALEREKSTLKLKQAGAQALSLRDLLDVDDINERKANFLRVKGQISRNAQEAISAGGDPAAWEGLLNAPDIPTLRLGLTRMGVGAFPEKFADARMGARSTNKYQFGRGETLKDEKTNKLYFATPQMDPQTGEVRAQIAGIDHNETPQGRLVRVSGLGLTPQETVKQKADEAAATRGAELKQELIWKSRIEADVAKARAEAKGQGEAAVELAQREAAMPGIREVVENLKELSGVATYTTKGKIFDLMVKELGFGSTQGATARAKYISIIDNQVLPLLKPILGAAFTEREGARLTATMGDPDASPEQKNAALDAFLAQAERQIEILKRQTAPVETVPEIDPDLLQYMSEEERALFK